MRIDKIYIHAFGGLKDFTLDLKDGFNVYFAENESGKTTVMAFIKSMFYGTGQKVKSLDKSIRAKYTPWDGSEMGGKIYFEYASKNYCIERQFRKSDSTDLIKLWDLDLGESVTVGSDVGTKFFGLTADAFERCMFIGTSPSSFNEISSGELNSKLSALALTGDEDVSYQKVIKRITDAKELIISKSGRSGSYIKGLEELKEREKRLEEAKDTAKRRLEISNKLQSLKDEYVKLEAEYNISRSLYESIDDIKNAEKLRDFLRLKDELDSVNKCLILDNGEVIDDIFIGKIKFCVSKISALKNKINDIKSDIENLEAQLELSDDKNAENTATKLDDIRKKINELQTQSEELTKNLKKQNDEIALLEKDIASAENAKKPFNTALLLMGSIIILAGILTSVSINQYALLSVSAVGLIILLLSFVIRPKNKKLIGDLQRQYSTKLTKTAEIKNEIASTNEQITAYTGQMNLLSSALNTNTAIRAQRMNDIAQKRQVLSAENERLSENCKTLNGLFGKSDNSDNLDDIEKKIESISENLQRQRDIKQNMLYISRDIGNFSYDEAKNRLEKISANPLITFDADIEKIKSERERLSGRISELKAQIASADTELKTLFRGFENPETIRRENEVLRENLKADKAFCESAEIACEVLSESLLEARRGYGGLLEEKTLEIFANITGGKYNGMRISKDFNITVEETGIFGSRELDYLSAGATDQAYLSMRLAISQLISANEPIPIMLDDSLSQYDDTRVFSALKFLKEYCKENQAFLFTCHKSLCDTATQLDIAVLPLKQ